MSDAPVLTMDFETRSDIPIRKAGAARYATDETTEVMMLAARLPGAEATDIWYSREVDAPAVMGAILKSGPDKGTRRTLLDAIEIYSGDAFLKEIDHAARTGCIIEAHNMMFEWQIWHNIMVPKYGVRPLDPRQVRCSAAKAASYSLPRSLEGVGAALQLDVQKDLEGGKLLKRLCKMRHPTKDNPRLWFGDQAEILRLGEYCIRDVDTEIAVSEALPDLPQQEWDLWIVDQAMNNRGVQLDIELIKKCQKLAAEAKIELNKELFYLTGIEKTSQRQRLLDYFREEGVPLENMQAGSLDAALESGDLDKDMYRAIEVVREGNKTTTSKLDAMLLRAQKDGRARDNLMFHAASTGRWGGRGIQLQNLKRGSVKDMDKECRMLGNCDIDLLMDITDKPIDRISGAIRGMIIPSPGKEFIVADYSAVEARGLMWVANAGEALEVFRSGADIYNSMASDIYGRPVDRKRPEDAVAGQLGKQAILGLGYQMGGGKFLTTCRGYNIAFSSDLIRTLVSTEEYAELKESIERSWHVYEKSEYTRDDIGELVLSKFIVNRYRAKYPEVTALWKDLEMSAIQAIKMGMAGQAKWVKAAGGKIHYKMIGTFLACRLPSGRMIWYPNATLKQKKTPWSEPDNPTYKESIRYMGVDSNTKRWAIQWTYGGKLCENVIQAICRDLMGYAMKLAEASGTYIPILTVHDELITEVVAGEGDVEEFCELICRRETYAADFPLQAEGQRLLRYKK